MIINEKLISIPPYLSTDWSNVRCLHMDDNRLVVTLTSGQAVMIPQLEKEMVQLAFTKHASFLEGGVGNEVDLGVGNVDDASASFMETAGASGMEMPLFRMGLGPGMENFSAALQHNPAQASSPDLPLEILQKIASVAKIVAPDDPDLLPKAEPHCNCIHCQIARAIHGGLESEAEAEIEEDEEEVTNEDLSFQQWDIEQIGENLHSVTNRLDSKESYKVYIGDPVGCTCGTSGCEHIVAVLQS